MEIQRVPWAGWSVVSHIGSGGFGSVYEIHRDRFGYTERAAVKVIEIPAHPSDIEAMRSDGFEEESIAQHFKEVLEDIVREYSLMAEMKGHSNIVDCDDLECVPHGDGIGWTIYIRMELLTPVLKDLAPLSTGEGFFRLARDLCNALILCKSRNVIHRDVKPQNVFVTRDGNYKLGDFGIAKNADRITMGPRMGTYKYMAPEIYNNQPYGTSADIYSLGLMLYRLLNDRRDPFLPGPPAVPTMEGMNEAQTRRLHGDPLPPPRHGDETIRKIVAKACAFRPEDRYTSPEELLADLEKWATENPQTLASTIGSSYLTEGKEGSSATTMGNPGGNRGGVQKIREETPRITPEPFCDTGVTAGLWKREQAVPKPPKEPEKAPDPPLPTYRPPVEEGKMEFSQPPKAPFEERKAEVSKPQRKPGVIPLWVKVVGAVLVFVLLGSLLIGFLARRRERSTYKEACNYMEDRNYAPALELLKTLGDYKDAEGRVLECAIGAERPNVVAKILLENFPEAFSGEEYTHYFSYVPYYFYARQETTDDGETVIRVRFYDKEERGAIFILNFTLDGAWIGWDGLNLEGDRWENKTYNGTP